MRFCNRCKIEKPLSGFYKDNKNRGNKLRTICIECVRIESVRRHRENPQKYLFIQAKKRAKRDNLPFDLEVSDIVIPELCPILGIKLEMNYGKGFSMQQDNSSTLDKIIPILGYVKGNVRVISWRANSLKKNGTLEEFESIVKYLRSHGDTTH